MENTLISTLDQPNVTVAFVTFNLGRLVITPGALQTAEEKFNAAGDSPVMPGEGLSCAARLGLGGLLARHSFGDWSEMEPEDARANQDAVAKQGRVFSSYQLPGYTAEADGPKVWIITEWDRSFTTILMPDEY